MKRSSVSIREISRVLSAMGYVPCVSGSGFCAMEGAVCGHGNAACWEAFILAYLEKGR